VSDNPLHILELNISNLSARDAEFAASLINQAVNRGLSEKQVHWVNVLSARAAGTEAKPEAVQVGDIAPIVALIARARSCLKWPTVLLEGGLRVSIAGEQAREPGSITIVSTEVKADGKRPWLGRITKAGVYEPNSYLAPWRVQEVAAILVAFAADPAGVAAAFGHRTGHCCFCNKKLDDERSTAVGYG
jgi:hypothetical protein